MSETDKSIFDRTSLANFAAICIIIAGLGYIVWYQDIETLKLLLGFSTGWLFHKEVASK